MKRQKKLGFKLYISFSVLIVLLVIFLAIDIPYKAIKASTRYDTALLSIKTYFAKNKLRLPFSENLTEAESLELAVFEASDKIQKGVNPSELTDSELFLVSCLDFDGNVIEMAHVKERNCFRLYNFQTENVLFAFFQFFGIVLLSVGFMVGLRFWWVWIFA